MFGIPLEQVPNIDPLLQSTLAYVQSLDMTDLLAMRFVDIWLRIISCPARPDVRLRASIIMTVYPLLSIMRHFLSSAALFTLSNHECMHIFENQLKFVGMTIILYDILTALVLIAFQR